MTLREILTFEVLRDTAPEILAGQAELDREVRWVHSSEIYEIAPLLSGGELLLTTGLGLADSDVASRRRYIRDLATRGVAGVAIEVGRTFTAIPADMVDEAQRTSFPLLCLNEVVPFIRVTEVVNTALIDYSSRGVRRRESISRALNEALIAGATPDVLLQLAANLTQAAVALIAPNGAVVSGHGLNAPEATSARAHKPAAEVVVHVDGGNCRLVAYPGSPLSDEELLATLELTSVALAVALLRTEMRPFQRDRQAALLLADLLDGAQVSEADASLRARLAGLHVRPEDRTVGVALHPAGEPRVKRLIDTTAQLLGSIGLCAQVDQLLLAVFVTGNSVSDAVGAVHRALSEASSRHDTATIRIGIGHAAGGGQLFAELGSSLRSARAVLGLLTSDHQLQATRIASSRELALDLHLSRAADAQERGRIVQTMIGPIVAWDDAHGTELVRTLDVYLRHGCSPTRTAGSLYVGRQALYQRIERIELLLGHSVSDPDLHSALLMATTAHRLQSE